MIVNEVTVHFFAELAIILAACRVVGYLARYLGQPQVVGEMIAGVCLGPSLLGSFAPAIQQQLFPPGPSMTILYTLSQIGLVLYMFLIGTEFDTGLIRNHLRTGACLALAGILVPLACGAAIAAFLVNDPGVYFSVDVALPQAMLFMGAAIATTAFPMLARIVVERGLARTTVGTLALAAGAADDAMSWCILAVVLAFFSNDPTLAILAIGGAVVYTTAVLTIGKRALRGFESAARRHGGVSSTAFAAVLVLLLLSAWLTDTIGIYSIFGAFILGIAMPRGVFITELRTMLQPLVTNLLLPLFFVFSGLNTHIGLVNSAELVAVTLLILFVSVLAKGGACWLAARLNGVPQREALALGSLMNARGLIELILLNIGLQAGLITPTLFTILVLMAIVTTVMATPLFELTYGRYARARATTELSVGLVPEESTHPQKVVQWQ